MSCSCPVIFKTYFKFVHSELPTYLLELPFDLNVTIHNHNTRGHNKIHANVVIHEFAKRCLRYNIIKTVNNSPSSVINYYSWVGSQRILRFSSYRNTIASACCLIVMSV